MKAKYDSFCGVCRRPIKVGDEITKQGKSWVHAQHSISAPSINSCNRCGYTDPTVGWRGICSECIIELKKVRKPDWTPELVREWLLVDNGMVERAVLALFDRQTSDERETEDTVYKNHKGFSAADARRLSKAAKWLIGGNHIDGWHLAEARKRVLKYARQLCIVISENQAQVQAEQDMVIYDPHLAAKSKRKGWKVKVNFGAGV